MTFGCRKFLIAHIMPSTMEQLILLDLVRYEDKLGDSYAKMSEQSI